MKTFKVGQKVDVFYKNGELWFKGPVSAIREDDQSVPVEHVKVKHSKYGVYSVHVDRVHPSKD